MLLRVNEKSIPLVRRALQWITYAFPKLRDEALVEIVSMSEDDTSLNPEAYPEPEELLKLCGSLIRRGPVCLELAHFTVQEYLEAIPPEDPRVGYFHMSLGDRAILAKTCIAYLSLPSFDKISTLLFSQEANIYRFHKHAAKYLPRYISGLSGDSEILDRLKTLFSPEKSYNFTLFILEHLKANNHLDSDKMNRLLKGVCSNDYQPLHAAAMMHIKKICEWLIGKGCDVNRSSPLGTPLECAVLGPDSVFTLDDTSYAHLYDVGTTDTIMTLLRAGATFDEGTIKTHLGVTMSFVACWGPLNSSGPFAKLLEYGMQIQADAIAELKGLDQKSIQEVFVVLGQMDQAQILTEAKLKLLRFAEISNVATSISVPVSEDMVERDFYEALAYAFEFDDVDALRVLVHDRRFSVDMTLPSQTCDPLSIAVRNQSIAVANLLLDLGADASTRHEYADDSATPLDDAIRCGLKDDQLLRRLVTNEAVETLDRSGRSIWHKAAYHGRAEVIDLLLKIYGNETAMLRAQSTCHQRKTPLLEAIMNGHSECAMLLIENLAMDHNTFDDYRILQHSVATGLSEIVQHFLAAHEQPRTIFERERYALHFLTSKSSIETLDVLLTNGFDPNHRDVNGRTPIANFFIPDELPGMKGTRRGDEWFLDLELLKKIATEESMALMDNHKRTPWFYFCKNLVPAVLSLRQERRVQLPQILLTIISKGALNFYEKGESRSGISLLVKGCLDSPSLSDASKAQGDSDESVNSMLLEIVNSTIKIQSFVKDAQAVRLLAWSTLGNHRTLVVKLLALGVDGQAPCSFYRGYSAVDMCMERSADTELLSLFLKYADPTRFSTLDEDGQLIYLKLCRPSSGEKSVHSLAKLEALLQVGIDPNMRALGAGNCATFVHAAITEGKLEYLKLLTRFGADLHLRNAHGWTPLQLAVSRGELDIIRYLREKVPEDAEWMASCALKGDSTSPLGSFTYNGCNLLHLAIFGSNPEVLEFLMGLGGFDNVDVATEDGVTPLLFAVSSTYPGMARWLLAKGANANVYVGPDKMTALHLAMNRGHLCHVIALLKYGAKFAPNAKGITPEASVNPQIRADLLQILPNCGIPIPQNVMETIEKDHKLQSLGGLYNAIVDGNLETCRNLVQNSPILDKRLHCGRCTPLLVALAEDKVDIASLLLQHGASTAGVPCTYYGMKSPVFLSALTIAASKPKFNELLPVLLQRSLHFEDHWTLDTYNNPFHLAAAFNPSAIGILMDHLITYKSILRCVSVTKSFTVSGVLIQKESKSC